MEGKQSRLADLLIDGSIDNALFQSKRSLLLQDQRVLKEKLSKMSGTDADRVNRMKFLELAKSLIYQYENGDRQEKRRMVQIATSNRQVIRKNVVLEPSNELSGLQKA